MTLWPQHRRERRSWVVVLAAVLLVGAAGCSGDGGDDAAEDTAEATTSTEAPATTAPPGIPPGATEVGFAELGIGQCFNEIDAPLVSDLAVWRLDCASPHTFEIYDQFDYGGETADGAYPGTAVVQDWAERACHDRFEAFVGTRWTLSELEIQLWWPSAESWDRGDDTIICAVLEASGDPVTGTLRGAAR